MPTDHSPSHELNPSAIPLLEYVTTTGCADCRRLEELLSRVQTDFPNIEVREIPGESERGLQLSVGRGVLRFPIILLDDEIIGVESIAEDDLRHALAPRVDVR